MPLTLVATPGASDANAYADLVYARAYAEYRVGANAVAFIALIDAADDKAVKAMVTAATDIDSLHGLMEEEYTITFPGEKTDPDQSMEWPRDGETTNPADLMKANVELAISYVPMLNSATVDVLSPNPTDARVKRKKVDVLETEYFEPGAGVASLARLPGIVQRLMNKLMDWTLSAGDWGTGRTIRGS